ncbi:MAG: response regulator [Elusimicrobiota bacterium]
MPEAETRADDAEGERPDGEPAREPKACLLIIDDNRELLDTMEAALDREYAIAGFDSGSAFPNNPGLCRPDIIILDVDMPEVDGFSLCRAIRSRREFRDTPILFLTGLLGDCAPHMGLEAGGDAYMSKPFEMSELKERIASLMKGRLAP